MKFNIGKYQTPPRMKPWVWSAYAWATLIGAVATGVLALLYLFAGSSLWLVATYGLLSLVLFIYYGKLSSWGSKPENQLKSDQDLSES
ncbi:MAG: hypothetical protein OXG25_08485 [Gammaproteobacteria bacterium]|nr:hypothetical protein [Gammaproteobacteria bacterium]